MATEPIIRKPVRLEINNSGAWKLIGTFDAADDEETDAVLDAAERLIEALNWRGFDKHSATMRVSADDGLSVLMRWAYTTGWVEVVRAKRKGNRPARGP